MISEMKKDERKRKIGKWGKEQRAGKESEAKRGESNRLINAAKNP